VNVVMSPRSRTLRRQFTSWRVTASAFAAQNAVDFASPNLGMPSASDELHRKLESAMLAVIDTLSLNPLFLRHDLLIEMGRLQMAIENASTQQSANDHGVAPLQQKLACINEALNRLSA
jgi:hypothetical protein